MKLSEQLEDYHQSGDFGQALSGCSEKAVHLEDLLMLCIKDCYSQSGKFKKSTAREIMRYVYENKIVGF